MTFVVDNGALARLFDESGPDDHRTNQDSKVVLPALRYDRSAIDSLRSKPRGGRSVVSGPEELGGDGVVPAPAVMVRSEEEIVVTREWRPAQRVRVAKRIVTETRSVTVRREELVFEELAPDASGTGSGPGQREEGPWEFILREEQVVLVPVAVERVQVEVRTVDGLVDVSGEVRKERIEVAGLPETGMVADDAAEH